MQTLFAIPGESAWRGMKAGAGLTHSRKFVPTLPIPITEPGVQPASGEREETAGMEEQRRNPRYQCAGMAEIRLSPGATPISARILNLSLEGCLIGLQLPESLPRQLKVELMFSVNGLPFRVWGRLNVVRVNHSLGFQFTHVSERAVRQLEELMEELAAERQKNKTKLRLVKKPGIG